MHRILAWGALATILVACGCSSSTTPSTDPGDSGSGGGDTMSSGDTNGSGTDTGTGATDTGSMPMDDTGTPETSAGGTTISGSAAGMPFTMAANALWLGSPDDPKTIVVYVFSKPTKCADLSAMGWDGRITDKTQFLEMKSFGTTPGTYTATSSMTPAPGECSVNYSLTKFGGVSAETAGSGAGKVIITAVNAMTNVTGSFDLKFGSTSLTGTFDAKFCPGGVEP